MRKIDYLIIMGCILGLAHVQVFGLVFKLAVGCLEIGGHGGCIFYRMRVSLHKLNSAMTEILQGVVLDPRTIPRYRSSRALDIAKDPLVH